ncbi:MAG TPA: PEPxxWA-CTERM sorting domain-containing protein [Rhodocyclaceae bacterium]|nr:PEPxxWA-CTERM sorting domain-containing protein [Rhodocyclaceae bacterium]
MNSRTRLGNWLAIAVLATGSGQALAATYDLDLSGTVSDGTYGSLDWNNTHYDQWSLALAGLNPFSVSAGDIINATITLNQSFTVPASVDLTWMELVVGGAQFPSVDTATQASVAFFNNGIAGPTGGNGCSTSGQLASCALFYPPNNGSFAFDKVTWSFTITDLSGQSANVDHVGLGYSLFSPAVPEPETYAMMIAGLGLVGVMARRRRQAV